MHQTSMEDSSAGEPENDRISLLALLPPFLYLFGIAVDAGNGALDRGIESVRNHLTILTESFKGLKQLLFCSRFNLVSQGKSTCSQINKEAYLCSLSLRRKGKGRHGDGTLTVKSGRLSHSQLPASTQPHNQSHADYDVSRRPSSLGLMRPPPQIPRPPAVRALLSNAKPL